MDYEVHSSSIGLMVVIARRFDTVIVTCCNEKRPYVKTSDNMRACKRWGFYYTTRPDVDGARCMTQLEFDEYTKVYEGQGVNTKSCNAIVYDVIQHVLRGGNRKSKWNMITLSNKLSQTQSPTFQQSTLDRFFKQRKVKQFSRYKSK